MKRDKNEFRKQDSTTSEDDSSSSEDDENAELLTEELEDGFFKVLSKLKKKDPKLYEESVKFFPGNTLEGDAQSAISMGKTKKKLQKEYTNWLKGERKKFENEKVKEELEALHDFWTNPNLNKDEQFLRDYILNKKFLEPDDSFNIDEEIQKLSDEEKEVEEQIRFEHQYNCRFENPGQALVGKSKSKRKKNKADKEVHENDNSLRNNITLENEESSEKDMEKDTSNKKRKKKRNRNSENKIILEETEAENNKVQKFARKKHDEKSLKRKRNNSVENKVVKSPSNIGNEELDKNTTLHPKKKFKRKRNLHKSAISDTLKNVKVTVQKSKLKPTQGRINLPRNLQLKNEKGKNKMRHRNRNKAHWVNNKVSVSTDGKMKNETVHPVVGHNHKRIEKEQKRHNGDNRIMFGAKKKINKIQTKQNKHFQNLIVKEKKNKELRFRKMRSKKNKAGNVGKR